MLVNNQHQHHILDSVKHFENSSRTHLMSASGPSQTIMLLLLVTPRPDPRLGTWAAAI